MILRILNFVSHVCCKYYPFVYLPFNFEILLCSKKSLSIIQFHLSFFFLFLGLENNLYFYIYSFLVLLHLLLKLTTLLHFPSDDTVSNALFIKWSHLSHHLEMPHLSQYQFLHILDSILQLILLSLAYINCWHLIICFNN